MLCTIKHCKEKKPLHFHKNIKIIVSIVSKVFSFWVNLNFKCTLKDLAYFQIKFHEYSVVMLI